MRGDVSFIELGSAEIETRKSEVFFQELFGWHFQSMPQGGGWFQAPRLRIGLHGNDAGAGIYVFFEVTNLEEAMAIVQKAGGEADPSITEEPGFGRFANCRDPQGIRFGLHQRPVGE
jgi:uncharacterized protein